MKSTVVLADDDALVRDGLRVLVDLEDDFSVVAAAENGWEAVLSWREHQPDLVLMDIRMPEMDGVEATRRILSEDPQARVMVLTTFQDDEYVRRALELGASGYLLKSQSAESILAAMRAVCAGSTVLNPAVIDSIAGDPGGDRPTAERIVPGGESPTADGNAPAEERTTAAGNAPAESDATRASAHRYTGDPPSPRLTDREQAVLRLVGEGRSNREIAAALHLGEGTVRNYVSELLFKLHLRDRTQLAIYFHRVFSR